MSPAPRRPRRRRHGALFWVLAALGGLLALVLLLVTGALVYLNTAPGEARLKALALEAANASLTGRVDVGRVDLQGNVLVLTDLELYDPDGELVAEVARVEAAVAIGDLLVQREVALTRAYITRPRLYLEQDARGLDLMRALEPREVKPEDPTQGRGTLELSLADFQLREGYVDFQQEAEGETPARHVRLEDLAADGDARYAAAEPRFGARLTAKGRLTLPLEGPLTLALDGEGEGERVAGNVALGLAGLALEARGESVGTEQARVSVTRLELPPAPLRALLPTWPLQVPLRATAQGERAGNLARLTLDAAAGAARLHGEGALDVVQLRSDGVKVTARDVDLGELLEGAPRTRLDGELTARGGGTTLEDLDGVVDLSVRPGRVRTESVGPVELHASAKGGRFELRELLVHLPGARLTAKGAGTRERLAARGALEASDLGALSRALGRLMPGAAPRLSGQGALRFSAEGPTRHPGVALEGRFPALGYEDVRVRALALEARVEDVTRPLNADVRLGAAEVRQGTRRFERPELVLTTEGRALSARAAVHGAAELALELGGQLDPDRQGLAIERLRVRYPEASWSLERASHLRLGETLRLTPLALSAGPQRLTLALEKAGPRVAADVRVEALELERLPRAFVPAGWQLGGTLDTHLTARGALPRPDATLSVKLSRGRYQGYTGVDLVLDGRYARDRAQGEGRVSLPAGALGARFDVPVEGLKARRRVPLDVQLTLEPTDLRRLLALAGQARPVDGTLEGRLTLTGLASDPRLALVLGGRGLKYAGNPPDMPFVMDPVDFTLEGGSEPGRGALGARLALTGLASEAFVELHTPWTLSRLLARPPTPARALATPVQLTARVRDFPLRVLRSMPGFEEADGRVSLALDAEGPPRAPEGTLEVTAQGVSVRKQPPLDATLRAVAEPERLVATLGATRLGQAAPLASARLVVDAPLARLQDTGRLGDVPVSLTARLAPIALLELPGLAPPVEAAPGKRFNALLALELSAGGTLAAPEVDAEANLVRAGMGELGLGRVNAVYRYRGGRNVADVLLVSPQGGSLRLEGALTLDLSLPALRRGLAPDRAPLSATLRADRFDLGFLSGAAPQVRQVGGTLEADARVAGTLAAPNLRGRVEWKDGRVGLEGYGDYRDVHVRLDVTEQRLVLSDLAASAGAGWLKLVAEADRAGDEWRLSGKGQSKDFPLVVDDQLLALLSIRSDFQGSLSERLVNLRELNVREAHVQLPEEARKELQELDRPEDVYLVRNGVPVDRKRARLAREAARRPGTREEAQTGGAGVRADVTREQAAEAAEQEEEPAPEEEAEEVELQGALRQYWVNINAPRNLWVHGPDVNVEVGLSDDFRVEYAQTPQLYGEVRVLRGRVDVLGRRFDAQRDSTVRFTGPAKTPYVNVTAQHVNEREQVTVFVTVRGQGKDVTLKPTSQPPLPESEIYTLLATGRRSLKRGSGASMSGSAQAASVLGSLLASQAKKTLAAKLPIDVLSIEAGEEGLAGASLELGTYVTDKLYVGYTGRIDAQTQRGENANAVRLEYQFSPRWSFEGSYGDANSGAADLIWSKEY